MTPFRNPARSLSVGAALALVATLIALPLVAAPAYADPPVTVDDETSVFPGSYTSVDVLANDSDPDGNEDLTVCRIEGDTRRISAVFQESEGTVDLLVTRRAKPGVHTITYYACDFETLVPATLTVTVLPVPKVRVTKLDGRPGKLKVKNPADVRILFLFGSFREEEPDGVLRVRKNSSKVFTVRRTRIDWIALGKTGFYVRGRVKNIQLPPGTTAPDASTASGGKSSARALRVWQRLG
jgi:hypothetical protein